MPTRTAAGQWGWLWVAMEVVGWSSPWWTRCCDWPTYIYHIATDVAARRVQRHLCQPENTFPPEIFTWKNLTG